MSAQFGLYLGEDQIPVINWINRHGSPEGKQLRFTVPTEVKAKLEANQDATFRIERDGEKWDFELLTVTQHGTGTNGVRATGRVKTAGAPPKAAAKVEKAAAEAEKPAADESTADKKPGTGIGIPKLDGLSAPSSPATDFSKKEKSSLRELLLKKKAERQSQDDDTPKTVSGIPAANEEE